MYKANELSAERSSNDDVPMGEEPPRLHVAHLGPADIGDVRRRRSLDILVPGDRSSLVATFRSEGGRDRRSLVRAPLVSILPPALAHSLDDAPGSNTLILSIAASFFTDVARRVVHRDDVTLDAFVTNDPLIREVGNAVDRDCRSGRGVDANYAESLAVVLSVHIARNYSACSGTGPAPTGGLAPHKLDRARKFISEHLAETIPIERLAEEVRLSTFHFARMFKQSTGQSPHMYILMQRIERAKELLAHTEAALVYVSSKVGFGTQGHFTEVFRRYTGLTPKVFRLRARSAADASSPPAQGAASGDRPVVGTDSEEPT